MDQDILVARGQALIAALDQLGKPPRAVVWSHTSDNGIWRLLVVPPDDLKDKRDFYILVSRAINGARESMRGLEASDVEMRTKEDPPLRVLGSMFRIGTDAQIFVEDITANGVYFEKGIILRMR